jgi:hypothetical protein
MWLEHHAHPIFSASGKATMAVCLIRDITERKEAEDALKRYNSELQKSAEDRVQIMFDNTPLAITGVA